MRRAVKRAMDVLVAATGLVALAPVMVGTALAVRIAMERPVLYRQKRPGYRGLLFEIVKFRTMLGELDADGRALPAHKRITPLGQLLRRTSLDELPELWNILKGEMSLVGPRPLLMEYLPHYTPEQARREAGTHRTGPGQRAPAARFRRSVHPRRLVRRQLVLEAGSEHPLTDVAEGGSRRGRSTGLPRPPLPRRPAQTGHRKRRGGG